MSNSSTGGYLNQPTTEKLPPGLTLEQFLQTVVVGISGYHQQLVRPNWQLEPPKQPDVATDWIAFGVSTIAQDDNAFVGHLTDTTAYLTRQQDIDVQLSFYGPNAIDNIPKFVDGFQITQNLEALTKADMGYKGFSKPTRMPDLINERWVQKWIVTLTLVRKVLRTYPILSFASVSGTINTVVQGNNYVQTFQAP